MFETSSPDRFTFKICAAPTSARTQLSGWADPPTGDVALDPGLPAGSEGAPLVDSRGRFLGITVETRSRGTNYAVPAHRLTEVLPALLRGRSTAAMRPGFIGISAGRMTRERAGELGIAGGIPVTGIINSIWTNG